MGSRWPSIISGELARMGVTIVSGLAHWYRYRGAPRGVKCWRTNYRSSGWRSGFDLPTTEPRARTSDRGEWMFNLRISTRHKIQTRPLPATESNNQRIEQRRRCHRGCEKEWRDVDGEMGIGAESGGVRGSGQCDITAERRYKLADSTGRQTHDLRRRRARRVERVFRRP